METGGSFKGQEATHTVPLFEMNLLYWDIALCKQITNFLLVGVIFFNSSII